MTFTKMKIGYAMLYPYRGSIHNMIYISNIFKENGHENHFLHCAASVPNCYNRMIKGTSKLIECTKCQIGGITSFPVENITRIDKNNKKKLDDELRTAIVQSTAFSLHRVETKEDCISHEVLATQKQLHQTADIVFTNALSWMRGNNLDFIIIFNGRLDMPRAVLMACEHNGTPYISLEAAYPGVQLEAGADCRSLKSLHRLNEKYKNIPLLKKQAIFSAKIAAQMLSKTNFVWRIYNKNSKKTHWPIKHSKNKILIVPSSNHECIDAADWISRWSHPLEGFEAIIKNLNMDFKDCVIRCHPNWNEKIGTAKNGFKSEKKYMEWAQKRGAHIIPSSSSASTNDLMMVADYILVQYGTAGIEGALMGKKVIAIQPAFYSNAGFSTQVESIDDLKKLDGITKLKPNAKEIARQALRFLYTYHKRYMQYTNYIKPISVHENRYAGGANMNNILNAIKNNFFDADDPEIAKTQNEEDSILHEFMTGTGPSGFLETEEEPFATKPIKISRKPMFKWIDPIRKLMKSGDA